MGAMILLALLTQQMGIQRFPTPAGQKGRGKSGRETPLPGSADKRTRAGQATARQSKLPE